MYSPPPSTRFHLSTPLDRCCVVVVRRASVSRRRIIVNNTREKRPRSELKKRREDKNEWVEEVLRGGDGVRVDDYRM